MNPEQVVTLDLPFGNLPNTRLLHPYNLIAIQEAKRIECLSYLHAIRKRQDQHEQLTRRIASTVASPNSCFT